MGIIVYEGRDGLSSGKVRKGDFWKLQPRGGDPSGEFSTIPMSSGVGQGMAVLCSSTEYYRNPLVFRRTLGFFPILPRPLTSFTPFLRVLLRLAFLYAPQKTLYFPHSTPIRAAAFLLLPIQFYAGTRLPWAVRNLFLSSCSHE